MRIKQPFSYNSRKQFAPMQTPPTPPPNHQPRDAWQRLLEFGWGLAPLLFLLAIVVLSFYHLTLAAIVLLAYTLGWLVRLIGYAYRLIGSYYRYRQATHIDWRYRLQALAAAEWHTDPQELYQAIILPVYNESPDLLEATVRAVVASDYPPSKMILIIAYEERGDAAVERAVQALIQKYGATLHLAKAMKHPWLPGNSQTKASNVTYAAKWLSTYCQQHGIAASKVVVTTLDADNRPHRHYLAALAYAYVTTPEPTRHSYQPIPLFTNNIWEAPAVSRVIAADTSFWFMMDGLRPRRLRLFSAYAQSLQTLEDTHYWNPDSIVEDGHQYWRTYFTYHGQHRVIPIWLPIYQDAVVTSSYGQTLKIQFRQLLRWAWSTADTPFIIRQAWGDRRIGWWNKTVHIARQVDDYFSWSTTPLVLAIGAWLPWIVEATRPAGHSSLAFGLFHVIVSLQLLALGDLLIAITIYCALLPARPARYSSFRSVMMVVQWVLEPVTLICFVSLASLVAHVRLVLNKPLKEFHVTTKT